MNVVNVDELFVLFMFEIKFDVFVLNIILFVFDLILFKLTAETEGATDADIWGDGDFATKGFDDLLWNDEAETYSFLVDAYAVL